jgi:hAT family C-terminal dimerisation region
MVSKKQGDFPNLYRLTLDLLLRPAMAAENEPVFSFTGKKITANRSQLDKDSI